MSLSKIMSSGAEQKPPILTLIDDCLDEIFDYLRLKDICAIGLTCKRLHQVAGAYFSQNYPLQKVDITSNRQMICSFETNFAPYAHQISIYNDKDFRYVASMKYRNLDGIEFICLTTFEDHNFSYLMNMNVWKKISSLKFNYCSRDFRNNMLNRILQFCTNLKCLIFTHERGDEELNCEWIHRTIHTLQHLESDDTLSNSKLLSVLQANPQIRQLVSLDGGLTFLNTVSKTDIVLDELEFTGCWGFGPWVRNQLIRNRLVALNEQGRYNRLSVQCDWKEEDSLNELKGLSLLTSLKILVNWKPLRLTKDLASTFATLTNLRKLEIPYIGIRAKDIDIVVQSLKNLEELHLKRGSVQQCLPFAQQLAKLRMIVATDESSKRINLNALNDDRTILAGVQKLTIYLRDEAFEQIRWTSLELFYEFVEVRRVVYPNKKRRLN